MWPILLATGIQAQSNLTGYKTFNPRTAALLMWFVSFLVVSVLAVLGAAIMVKKGGPGGFGKILTRV